MSHIPLLYLYPVHLRHNNNVTQIRLRLVPQEFIVMSLLNAKMSFHLYPG